MPAHRLPPPTPSRRLAAVTAAAALLSVLLAGCHTARHHARRLFHFSPQTQYLASWAITPDQLFPQLIAAAHAAFPDARIHAVPGQYRLRVWLRGARHEVACATLVLRACKGPGGQSAAELLALPLHSAAGAVDLPPRFPPRQRLLAELEKRCGPAIPAGSLVLF
ncbi:MAG: hypothetical protein JXQ71_00790 [Verrucomicrobia bacterium]|nr:hypothetical protein [Verrucomicrobiota bacterium]